MAQEFVHFSPLVTGNSVEIGNGEYVRQFARTDEPFAVTAEEKLLLLRTGLFLETENVTAPVGPDEVESQQEQI